jgi:RND family efflux transporter MFP subunit
LALLLGLPAAHGGASADWRVQARDIDDRKAVFATVESVDVTEARTRIGGTVEQLSVDAGSRVTKGQVIAVVRDPKLKLEEASLNARIDSLQAQLKQAKTSLRRVQQLRGSGTASQSQLDDAQTTLDVVTGQLAEARAEREVLRERLTEGEVLAPDSGRVLKKHVLSGTVVLPGEPVATIAVERYVLRLRLPERHARFIGVGDPVVVGARGLADSPQETRQGTIRKVYPELENGQVVADVEVQGLGDYFVGERTRVWVSTGRRRGILIPSGYVRTRYGIDYVQVRAQDGTPVQVVVQVGRVQVFAEEGELVEVLSGLRPGDRLVEP